jgi:hypothetical protein
MVTMACETRHRRCGEPCSSGCHIVGRPPRRCHSRPAGGPARHDVVGRYYDPATGQFLSVDPNVEQTLEAYLYVADNPVSGHDPTGMFNVGFADRNCSLGGKDVCPRSQGGGFLFVFVRAIGNIAHTAAHAVASHAGEIATAASLVALAIPGVDVVDLGVVAGLSVNGALALSANVVAITVGGVATDEDVKRGDYVAAAFDVVGSVAGIGGIHLSGLANLGAADALKASNEVVADWALTRAASLAKAARVAAFGSFFAGIGASS